MQGTDTCSGCGASIWFSQTANIWMSEDFKASCSEFEDGRHTPERKP